MSILINRNTKVMTQGITGKTGQFHTRTSRDYANGRDCYVAGVNPKTAGEDFEGIPIYASVREAKQATGATVSVIYVPPAGAADAIWEAVEADLDLAICITEGIPVRDMIRVRDRMRKENRKTLLLGPNCPGVITPEELKIGIILSAIPDHVNRQWDTTGSRLKAERFIAALNSGADFEKLARDSSDDKETSKDGGMLPWISGGTIIKAVEDEESSSSSSLLLLLSLSLLL